MRALHSILQPRTANSRLAPGDCLGWLVITRNLKSEAAGIGLRLHHPVVAVLCWHHAAKHRVIEGLSFDMASAPK